MTNMTDDYDIIIAGGGLVGISMALALQHLPLNIALLDANPLSTTENTALEGRSLVLSAATVNIFKSLGVWEKCAPYATPIRDIHISDAHHFGKMRLRAQEYQVEGLGFLCPFARVQAILNQMLEKTNLVQLRPAQITQVIPETADTNTQIIFSQDNATHTAHTNLLIAADGARSFIREQFNIETTHKDYQQTAMVFNITLSRPQPLMAYERFTDTGPLAVLPISETMRAVIYTVPTAEFETTFALSDAALLEKVQTLFGEWLGRWKSIGKRFAHPLHFVQAQQVIAPGMVLCGNAAQSLHPVAGQGFNLGLRDVASLAEYIDVQYAQSKSFTTHWLSEYATQREKDKCAITHMVDDMITFFGMRTRPMSWLRNFGLMHLAALPLARRKMSGQAMGFGSGAGRLLTGLPWGKLQEGYDVASQA